jgi:hypothetical protein
MNEAATMRESVAARRIRGALFMEPPAGSKQANLFHLTTALALRFEWFLLFQLLLCLGLLATPQGKV